MFTEKQVPVFLGIKDRVEKMEEFSLQKYVILCLVSEELKL